MNARAIVSQFVEAFGEGRLDVFYKNPSAVTALLTG